MIREIFNWIKQKKRERRMLAGLEFWGGRFPVQPNSAPYRRKVKILKIDDKTRQISFGDDALDDRTMLPLRCEMIDTICWTGCPHYKSSLFFRTFEGGFTFCCRYHPVRFDAEHIDAPRKDLGDMP